MTNDRREIAALLSRCEPFSAAGEEELRALAAAACVRRFADGAAVYAEGEGSAAAWVVASGRVRILGFAGGGRTFQLERLEPGRLFGVCCRLGGAEDRYVCTAVAEGETEAVRIPDAALEALCRRSASVARAACALCASRLRAMRRLAGDPRGVRERLAGILLGLLETGRGEIRATRAALSAWVGAAPETVFRALADLRRRGIVRTGRGTVRVLDAEALAAESAGAGPGGS